MRLSNIDSIEDALGDPLPYILHLVKLLVIIDRHGKQHGEQVGQKVLTKIDHCMQQINENRPCGLC